MGKTDPWRRELGTECRDKQHGQALKAIDDLVEEFARGRIEPMPVFKHHKDRATRRKSIEPGQERPEEKRLLLLRRHVRQGAWRRALNSKQIGKERNCIAQTARRRSRKGAIRGA